MERKSGAAPQSIKRLFLLLGYAKPVHPLHDCRYEELVAGQKVLISPCAMQEISWEEKTFHLNVDRRTVKDSQVYDPTPTANGAEQFLKYFEINWVEK